MTEELKNCPFCDQIPWVEEEDDWDGERIFTYSHICEKTGRYEYVSARTMPQVIEAWNARAKDE